MNAPQSRPSGQRQRLVKQGVLAIALLFLSSPLAAQQPAGEGATSEAQLAGDYQLASADGIRTCPLTLAARRLPAQAEDQPTLYVATLNQAACGQTILFSLDVSAWSLGPGNAIRLHTATGKLIADFTEGIDGTWEALRERDGVYFLINPRLAQSASQTLPDELFGTWDLARTYGRPVCRLRLSDAPSRPAGYRLDPDAGCRLLFGRFMPERWRLEHDDLVLEAAAGITLRFAPHEEGGWEKVPEDNRPLFLTRTR